jgi:hypothetical protein
MKRSKESIKEGGKKSLIDYFKENVAKSMDTVCLVDLPNKQALMGLESGEVDLWGFFNRAVDAIKDCLPGANKKVTLIT